MHCHTSSGSYRFKKEKFNDACTPCHEDKVKDPAAHSRHLAESEGSKCISCHMPVIAFARINRSDHSMHPPTPAATMAYKSPNACNICHNDKDAEWADKYVRQWRTRDYQAPVLRRAALIDAARKRDWSKLPDMLSYIRSKDRNEVFAASLIRLISPVQDQNVPAALLIAAKDPSPLVRAAAIQGLELILTAESLQALIEATGDDFRLVRVRAAAGVTAFPPVAAQGAIKGISKRRTRNTFPSSWRGPTSGYPITLWATTSSTAARPRRLLLHTSQLSTLSRERSWQSRALASPGSPGGGKRLLAPGTK
jgi:hypothetical protein